MKKRKIMALLCGVMLLAGCANPNVGGEVESSETQASSEYSSEETGNEASTVATSEEAGNEASTAAITEEPEKETDTVDTTVETAESIKLEPAGITLVSDGANVPDTDLYFIYEDKGSKSSSIEGSVSIDTITLVNGENKVNTDIYGFYYPDSNKCTRLTTDDNREYIYFETDSDNDYFHLFVFDITDGNAKFVGDTWFSYTGSNSFDDPNNIEVTEYTECLCMFSYTCAYMVGPDGMPVPKSDLAIINGDRNIKSKKTLEFEVLDEDGNTTGNKITVPEGSNYKLVHVYKDCGIDAELDDGTIVRIPVTAVTYDGKCNGTPLDDLFSSGGWE